MKEQGYNYEYLGLILGHLCVWACIHQGSMTSTWLRLKCTKTTINPDEEDRSNEVICYIK